MMVYVVLDGHHIRDIYLWELDAVEAAKIYEHGRVEQWRLVDLQHRGYYTTNA